jgi:hypothetical protein
MFNDIERAPVVEPKMVWVLKPGVMDMEFTCIPDEEFGDGTWNEVQRCLALIPEHASDDDEYTITLQRRKVPIEHCVGCDNAKCSVVRKAKP